MRMRISDTAGDKTRMRQNKKETKQERDKIRRRQNENEFETRSATRLETTNLKYEIPDHNETPPLIWSAGVPHSFALLDAC